MGSSTDSDSCINMAQLQVWPNGNFASFVDFLRISILDRKLTYGRCFMLLVAVFCHLYLVRWLTGLGFVGFLFPCISSESWGKFMVETPKTSGRMGRPQQSVWQIRNFANSWAHEVFESSLELRSFFAKS